MIKINYTMGHVPRFPERRKEKVRMKKRVLASLLACGLALTLMPAASAAESDLIGVCQGDGIYVTIRPFEIKTPGFQFEYFWYAGFQDGYFPVKGEYSTRHGQSYGLADATGNVVTQSWGLSDAMILDEFYKVDNGVIKFWDGETSQKEGPGLPDSYDMLYGYRTVDGTVIAEPKYPYCYNFSDGRAVVVEREYQWGPALSYKIIDNTGKIVFTLNGEGGSMDEDWYTLPSFRNAIGYYGGYLAYYRRTPDDKEYYGFLDVNGNVLFELDMESKYENYSMAPLEPCGSVFGDGHVVFRDWRNITEEQIAYKEYEPTYAILDESGKTTGTFSGVKLLEESGNDGVSTFHSGLLVVQVQTGSGTEYGAVDTTGKMVFPLGSLTMYPFSNCGLGMSEEGNVIDTKGNVVIPKKLQLPGRPRPLDLLSGYGGVFSDGGLELANDSESYSYLTGPYYVLEAHQGTYTGSAPILYGGSGTTPTDPGTDAPSSWAAEQVNQAISAGIVPDSLQSQYTQTTTRAQFCALAVELYETVKGAEITERTTFTDTTDVNVQKMGALGIVTGVGGGKFNPDGTLTREQAATMLSRLAEAVGKPLPAQAPTFADNASVSSWAFDAVGQMQASGIMGGVGSNTFAPQGSYSREQSIITMLRLYEAVK